MSLLCGRIKVGEINGQMKRSLFNAYDLGQNIQDSGHSFLRQ